MKNQKYPQSVIKVGAIIYRVMAYVTDKGKNIVDLEEWHIRSIRKKRGSQSSHGRKVMFPNDDLYINAVQKIDGLTWGKLSKKNGDYGWLSSISTYQKMQFKVGNNLPNGFYTTKLSAYKYAVHESEETIKWYRSKLKNEDLGDALPEYEQELKEELKLLPQIKSRLTKLRNSK